MAQSQMKTAMSEKRKQNPEFEYEICPKQKYEKIQNVTKISIVITE